MALDCAGHLAEALSIAERADAVVLCLVCRRESRASIRGCGQLGGAGGKVDLDFPGLQPRLLESSWLWAGPPCWWYLRQRAHLAWAHDHVAPSQAFYPGEEAGSRWRLLFGDVSPAGRLPVTFPRSLAESLIQGHA